MADSLIETPDGWMTRKEAAAFYGIALGTITRRVWQGWPPERTFRQVRHNRRIIVKYRGEDAYLSDVAHWNTAKYKRARYRYSKGWPACLLLLPPLRAHTRSLLITPWGWLNMTDIAYKVGVSPKTVSDRLRRWSFRDALNTPGYGIRGKHYVMPPDEFDRRLKAMTERYG